MVPGIHHQRSLDISTKDYEIFQAGGAGQPSQSGSATQSTISQPKAESYGEMFSRYTYTVYDSIVWVLKKVACFFTAGYLFNNPTRMPASERDALLEAAAKRYNKEVKEAERKAIIEGVFKDDPILKEDTRAFFVNQELNKLDLSKATLEKKQKKTEKFQKKFDELFDKQDLEVLTAAQKMVKKQLKTQS